MTKSLLTLFLLFIAPPLTACGPARRLPAAVIGPDRARALSQKEISNHVETLLKWRDAAKYTYYLVSLPAPLNLLEKHAGAYPTLRASTSGEDRSIWCPSERPATECVKAHFSVPTVVKQKFNNRYEMFVEANGLELALPVEMADFLADSFTRGFITSLVVSEYYRVWGGQDELPFELGERDEKIDNPLKEIEDSKTWSEKTYRENATRFLRSHNMQAFGMLLGWQAGTEILKLAHSKDSQYLQAAWALIRNRYGPQEIGRIVGYTLNYLWGFTWAQAATMGPIKRLEKTSDANDNKYDKLLAYIQDCSDAANNMKDVEEYKRVLADFNDGVLLEFYQMASQQEFQKRQAILDAEYSFVTGLREGGVLAEEQIFGHTFRTAYELGYRQGFKDGYARGYADGYKDGYAAGYRQAWDQQQQIINKLKDQLHNARKQNWWAAAGGVVVGLLLGL